MSPTTTIIGLTVLFGCCALFCWLLYLGRRGANFKISKGDNGFAPGWQVRCATCGHTIPGNKAGVFRLGFRGKGRRYESKIWHCDICMGLRSFYIEQIPDEEVKAS
jgi:hypothetical protein